MTNRAPPRIDAVVAPGSVAEVIDLVRTARREGRALYPVSTGHNWGYGAAQPPQPGCTVVELRRLNRIRNAEAISAAAPVAIIEPGVTQGRLHEHLNAHCPTLTFNVTGSARETSILGNALDRGVGYMGPRREDVFGLEVVLGTGELLHTGFRRLGDQSPLAASHPYGLGPMLDGLFFQGNFGIVTSACFRLQRRRPVELAVSLALEQPARLPALIDELAALKRDGLLTSVTHIGNRARTRATLTAGLCRYLEQRCGMPAAPARQAADATLARLMPTEWTGLGAVTGNRAQVRAALQEIRSRLRGIARVRPVYGAALAWASRAADALRFVPAVRNLAAALAAIEPLNGLALGRPTDVAIDNLLWSFGQGHLPATELGRSDSGILYVNPALPLDGRFVDDTLRALQTVATGFSHELYITVNLETATSLVAVINLLFDKSDLSQVSRAHRCAEALLGAIRGRGLELYRARSDQMDEVVALNPAHWAQIRRLKQALDPDNVIAPGRYCPTGPAVGT